MLTSYNYCFEVGTVLMLLSWLLEQRSDDSGAGSDDDMEEVDDDDEEEDEDDEVGWLSLSVSLPPQTTLTTSQQTQNICVTLIQCWTNVKDIGPMLYKFFTNVLFLVGFCSAIKKQR